MDTDQSLILATAPVSSGTSPPSTELDMETTLGPGGAIPICSLIFKIHRSTEEKLQWLQQRDDEAAPLQKKILMHQTIFKGEWKAIMSLIDENSALKSVMAGHVHDDSRNDLVLDQRLRAVFLEKYDLFLSIIKHIHASSFNIEKIVERVYELREPQGMDDAFRLPQIRDKIKAIRSIINRGRLVEELESSIGQLEALNRQMLQVDRTGVKEEHRPKKTAGTATTPYRPKVTSPVDDLNKEAGSSFVRKLWGIDVFGPWDSEAQPTSIESPSRPSSLILNRFASSSHSTEDEMDTANRSNTEDDKSGDSDEDDEDADMAAFAKAQRELRMRRRRSSGISLDKRTHSELSDSDDDKDWIPMGDDVDMIGSSARRLRRRLVNRSSLMFQDPPPERIEELDEPDSCGEDIFRASKNMNAVLQKELPYWDLEVMEVDEPSSGVPENQYHRFDPTKVKEEFTPSLQLIESWVKKEALETVSPFERQPSERKNQHGVSGHVPKVRFEIHEPAKGTSPGASSSSCSDSYNASNPFTHSREASTAGTEVAIEAPNMSTVMCAFVDLIFREKDISKAMDVALQSEHKSQALLKADIRRTLKAFAAQLMVECPDHQPICKIFQGRSWSISSKIIDEAHGRTSLNNKMSAMGAREFPSRAEAENDDDEVSQSDGSGTDIENEEDEEDEDTDENVDVAAFQQVVSSSQAFGGLLGDLHDLVFPTFSSRLRDFIAKQRTKIGPSAELELGGLFSELSYARPSHINVSFEPPGLLDRLQLSFESCTRQTWAWKPLPQPLKPLQAGEARISWTCTCRKVRRSTVPKRLARQLAAIAQLSSSESMTSSGDVPLQSSSSNSGSTAPTSQVSDEDSGPLDGDASSGKPPILKDPKVNEMTGSKMEQPLPHGIVYFMTAKGAFHPGQEGLVRSFIASNNKCDHRFFAELKEEYWKHRGFLRRYLGLYGFKCCDFFKLRTYRAGRYEELAEGLPEGQHLGYSFKMRSHKPQVSGEEFRDHFHGCHRHCSASCTDTTTIDYIPRKVNAGKDQPPVVIKDEIFWGIIAREDDKKSVYMMFVYMVLVYLCLGIGIAPMVSWLDTRGITDEASLANRKDNLSNAVVPFNMIFCLLGPLVAVVWA